LKEDEKISDLIRDRLEKLADDVGAFEKEVAYKVDEAEATVNAQIESLKKRLPGLQNELQGCSHFRL
jgi:polyhydroxyalkanoate synthesis regulator phasin